MKSNFYKFKITFAILFGTLLSISPFNPVRLTNPKETLEVCAAADDIEWEDLGTGVSCVRKQICMGRGLVEKIASGEIQVNSADAAAVRNDDLKGYKWLGQDSLSESDVCITDNVTAISATQRGTGVGNAGWQRGLCTMEGGSTRRIEKMGDDQTICCPSNYIGAATLGAYNSSELRDSTFAGKGNYGCCPIQNNLGDFAVLTTSITGEQACSYYENPKYTGAAVTGADRITQLSESELGLTIFDDLNEKHQVIGRSFSEVFEVSINNTVVYAGEVAFDVDAEIAQMNNFLQSCSTGETMELTYANMTLNCHDLIAYTQSFDGNEHSCPANSCVLFDTGRVALQSQMDTAYVALKCERCFSAGEPVKVDPVTNQLSICDPTSSTAIREQALCNSSVIDTIACLGGSNSTSQNANSQGVGSTNYDLCCACRVQGGVWTGIGCTDTTPAGLITGLIRIVYGVMGGLALVMLIYAGIMYQTGNEANVKQARESIIRTITGLIVLTFSILILRIIGINVLDILPSGSI